MKTIHPFYSSLLPVLGALALIACDADEGSAGPDAMSDAMEEPDAMTGDPPSTYAFESRFAPGESSVSYSGQVFRQVLISELNAYIAGLTEAVDSNPPADDEILGGLLLYLDFDSSTSGDLTLALATDPAASQTTFNDISNGKDLRGKLAGNDSVTDHMDWNTPGNFVGWSEGGTDADTPTELVEYWCGVLDDLAFERVGGAPEDPDGVEISKVYITSKGQDLKQLIQKFLLGAVTFSQGHDDYLDDDVADKGLLSSNAQDEDNPYSSLEHQWDEGFGYFGAARNYSDYSDEEIAEIGYQDADNDGAIDLESEYNFGASTNCAKRDRGSADNTNPTDFTQTAFDALIAGRHIIASAGPSLTEDEMADLVEQRDIALETWEKCIAATVVHYINDTLADMATFDTEGYEFEDHAKHWSEMKGFALGLQFSRHSPLHEGTRFADFHNLVGDAPVLPNAAAEDIVDYKGDLEDARDILQAAYDFDPENVQNW